MCLHLSLLSLLLLLTNNFETIYLAEILTTQTEIIEKSSGTIGGFVIRRQRCVKIRIRARSFARPRHTALRNRRV